MLPRQMFWFAVSGSLGFVIDASVVQLLVVGLGQQAYWARVPAVLLAVTATWGFNRSITFAAQRPTDRHPFAEWTHYLVAQGPGLAVNYLCYVATLWLLPLTHRWPVLAVAAGALGGMVVNFIAARHWVFRPR